MNSKTIKHQLINQDFFTPNWKIKHLFLGTFNPEGGDEVTYFYGRSKNQTWQLLSQIFQKDLNPYNANFLEDIKGLNIACMDILQEVAIPTEFETKIVKGYKDSVLFHGKFKREFNIDNINQIIFINPGVQVYSTWGKGSGFNKEGRIKVEEISANIIPLVSPSLAAKVPKGEKKLDLMLKDWKSKIIIQ